LVLPNQLGPETPVSIYTPNEFINALRVRDESFRNIQGMISKAGLNED
jgi:hypothetical protein